MPTHLCRWCMCTCVHVFWKMSYVHVHMCVCTCTCVHAYVRIGRYFVYVPTYMCVCVYVYVCIGGYLVYVPTCVCICVYVHMLTYVCTCTYKRVLHVRIWVCSTQAVSYLVSTRVCGCMPCMNICIECTYELLFLEIFLLNKIFVIHFSSSHHPFPLSRLLLQSLPPFSYYYSSTPAHVWTWSDVKTHTVFDVTLVSDEVLRFIDTLSWTQTRDICNLCQIRILYHFQVLPNVLCCSVKDS